MDTKTQTEKEFLDSLVSTIQDSMQIDMYDANDCEPNRILGVTFAVSYPMRGISPSFLYTTSHGEEQFQENRFRETFPRYNFDNLTENSIFTLEDGLKSKSFYQSKEDFPAMKLIRGEWMYRVTPDPQFLIAYLKEKSVEVFSRRNKI